MVSHKDLARALKYRRLALIEPDGQIALLLRKLADEAERGVLCTPDHLTLGGRTGAMPRPARSPDQLL
jgi:hypothetical protein